MEDRVQDFVAMLRAALGERLRADASSFIDMLADDAVMEFPFAPAGLPTRLKGRDAVADHLKRLAGLISFDRIGPAIVRATTPDVAVLEFTGSGRGLKTGAAYEQRYISVVETRDGRITRYSDYWDPLAVVRAMLGDAALEGLDAKGAYHD